MWNRVKIGLLVCQFLQSHKTERTGTSASGCLASLKDKYHLVISHNLKTNIIKFDEVKDNAEICMGFLDVRNKCYGNDSLDTCQ